MKPTILVLTWLTFMILAGFGYHLYREHKAAQLREIREQQRGYYKCVDDFDPNGTDAEARKLCRDIWIRNAVKANE
jgi:hypothetical protein